MRTRKSLTSSEASASCWAMAVVVVAGLPQEIEARG